VRLPRSCAAWGIVRLSQPELRVLTGYWSFRERVQRSPIVARFLYGRVWLRFFNPS
jgi:hypothetical protein